MRRSTRTSGRTIRRAGELDTIAKAWHAIEPQLTLPTQTHAWARSCASVFGGEQLEVHVLEAPAFAAAPLIWRARRQAYETLGTRELYEPSDFAYTELDALAALLEALARVRAPIRLPRLPASSPTPAVIRRILGRRALCVAAPCTPCPWVDLSGSGADADALLSRSMRQNLRTAMNRARRIGEVSVAIFDRTNAQLPLPQLLRDAFEIEARSWKGETRTALLHDVTRRTFFERYAALAWEQGSLRLAFLHIGDTVAATQISVESAHAWWTLKLGYDPEYSACSPGGLLMYETLRHAVARGLEAYEFLGAPAPWTARWTTAHRECLDLRIYPPSPRSAISVVWDSGAWAARRIRAAHAGR